MFKKITSTGLSLLPLLVALFWVGCSDDSIIMKSQSGADIEMSPVAQYFPLAEGYTTVYDITFPNYPTEIKSYTIGKEVDILGFKAVEWLSYSNQTGSDTGYFYATSNALYYFDSPGSSPEKILELPLSPGASWIRFGDDTDLTTNFTDSTNNSIFDALEDDVNGTTAKNYPTTGITSMTVEKIESLQLENGAYYSGTIKIFSENSSGTINQYWFALGVGLVRYVIDASPANPNGSEMGELKSYGIK